MGQQTCLKTLIYGLFGVCVTEHWWTAFVIRISGEGRALDIWSIITLMQTIPHTHTHTHTQRAAGSTDICWYEYFEKDIKRWICSFRNGIAASELYSSSLGERVWSKWMSTKGSRAALVFKVRYPPYISCYIFQLISWNHSNSTWMGKLSVYWQCTSMRVEIVLLCTAYIITGYYVLHITLEYITEMKS